MAISEERLRDEILTQIRSAVSVAPRDIAQALVTGDDDWRKLLPRIRAESIKLHTAGKLIFLRKRKPVGPEGLKGVYRLAKPGSE